MKLAARGIQKHVNNQGLTRVVVPQILFVINSPEVYKSPNSNTYM